MPSYSTPGVYIEEISVFPPSVAPVATAIPIFIGYTEKAVDKKGKDLTKQAVRLTSLLEYQALFGGAPDEALSLTLERVMSLGVLQTVEVKWSGDARTVPSQFLFPSLQLYFANGGGPCYVYSVGPYKAGDADYSVDTFSDAIAAIEAVDEPTLLVFPDALRLGNGDYGSVVTAALASCNKMQDRFTIADVPRRVEGDGDEIIDTNAEVTSEFREKVVGTPERLKYGAAYFPFVDTNIPLQYSDGTVRLTSTQRVILPAPAPADIPAAQAAAAASAAAARADSDRAAAALAALPNGDPGTAAATAAAAAADAAADAAEAARDDADAAAVAAAANGATAAQIAAAVAAAIAAAAAAAAAAVNAAAASPQILAAIKDSETTVYAAVRAFLADAFATLPPSGAIAGIYAQVDRSRGVWKAPANVPLSRVIGPDVKVTNDLQDGLNIDPDSGKSVNALRAFAGKGTLVWGARTLAGNDNEWRYVSVRRFVNFVEESVKKATNAFVFEPNDANTWVKAKTMIENFLINQWRDGALMGAKPEHAFTVDIGLGKTMTPQDVLDGYMVVDIGLAIVHPAEFIRLRIMQKMPQS